MVTLAAQATTVWKLPGTSEQERQTNNHLLYRRLREEDELYARGLTPGSRAWKNRMLQLNLRETGALSPVGLVIAEEESRRRSELITTDERSATIQHMLWEEWNREGLQNPRQKIRIAYEGRTYSYNDEGGIVEIIEVTGANTTLNTISEPVAASPPEPELYPDLSNQVEGGVSDTVIHFEGIESSEPQMPVEGTLPLQTIDRRPETVSLPVTPPRRPVQQQEQLPILSRVWQRFYSFEENSCLAISYKVVLWALSITGVFVCVLFLYEYCCPLNMRHIEQT